MARRRGCDGVAIKWDVKNPLFGQTLERTAEHVDTITRTTRLDVTKAVKDAYEQGLSVPDAAKQIRDVVRGSSLGRAQVIARTELNRLANGASLVAARTVSQAAGVAYEKRWLTAPGAEHPRHELYDGLDGQTVGLGETFDVGGADLLYPGDPDGPPEETINCRCSLEYIDQGDQTVGTQDSVEAGGSIVPALLSDQMHEWASNLTAGAVTADSDIGKQVGDVAAQHAPEGGYGDAAYNADERKVFWVSADWSTNDEMEEAERDFLQIDGVDSVDMEAEAALPEGDEWEVCFTSSASASGQPSRGVMLSDALVASGAGTISATYDMLYGSHAGRLFKTATMERGYSSVDVVSWPHEGSLLSGMPGEIMRDGDQAVLSLEDGTLVLLAVGGGWARVSASAHTREAVSFAFDAFRAVYPASYLSASEDGNVPVTFWMNSAHGPQSRLRRIDAAPWEAIRRNYTASVRDQLDVMMTTFEPGKGGLLTLWQGEPGTGKTWALRALIHEWGSWAEFHYITDPDAFFVEDASYMIDVLLAESYSVIDEASGDIVEADPEGKWRVLILEDTGELLSAKAKEKYGQGLSRLLNVVDGLIGQGLKVLVLVTTNDELGELNAAVRRPGRCAAQVEFVPMTAEEAAEWAGEDVGDAVTLADLYAKSGVGEDALEAAAVPSSAAMIALYPTAEQAAALAQHGTEPADDLHVTLAFLGSEVDDQTIQKAVAAVTSVAGEHGAMSGSVAGIGCFADNGDGHPTIALPDVPYLPELRQAVVSALADHGVGYSNLHGYTPHITLDYSDAPMPPSSDCLGQALDFGSVFVVRGNTERYEIPLTGRSGMTAGGEQPAADLPFDDMDLDQEATMDTETAAEEAAHATATLAPTDLGIDLEALGDALASLQPQTVYANGVPFGQLVPTQDINGVYAWVLQVNEDSSFAPKEDDESDDDEDDMTADAAADLLPPEHQPQDVRPEANVSPDAPDVQQRTNASETPWHATLAPEGAPTDDGRIFAPGSIGHRELPLSLMGMTETGPGGHEGAFLCGRIDSIYRVEDQGLPYFIDADGVFNADEAGQEIAQKVENRSLTGNSVDLAVSEYKYALKSDVLDENGVWKDGLAYEDVPAVSMIELFLGLVDPQDVLFVVGEALIGMSTVCPFPAFEEGTIEVTASGAERKWATFQGVLPHLHHVVMDDTFVIRHSDDAMTASAAGLAPVAPPKAWFEMEEPDELTPLTVTDEGQVYGHAWQWGECHIGIQDACTVAPHSKTGYGYYLLKEVETAEGDVVEVGTITLDTRHAGRGIGWRDAAAHYDNTGTAVVDVVMTEGKHGGWFCGALRPDITVEQVRKLKGASVSGDWRRIRGNLELVGLLSVNVPGFPVPRPKALVASVAGEEEVLELLTAGIVTADTADVETADIDFVEIQSIVAGLEDAAFSDIRAALADLYVDDFAALAAEAR